jgi:hypothetical protein
MKNKRLISFSSLAWKTTIVLCSKQLPHLNKRVILLPLKLNLHNNKSSQQPSKKTSNSNNKMPMRTAIKILVVITNNRHQTVETMMAEQAQEAMMALRFFE